MDQFVGAERGLPSSRAYFPIPPQQLRQCAPKLFIRPHRKNLKTKTNISVASMSSTSFTEVINYTAQAASRVFNTFSLPMSSNKIVLFITSCWTDSA